jgi:acyl-CoA dehydrogenase
MNFDFSDELKQLRDQARRFLGEHSASKQVRQILEGRAPYDRALWQGIAEMGWMGTAIPEEYGGAGMGHLGLCILAEEMGRSLAPIPFASSAYLAAEAIMLAGSPAQKAHWLPKFAAGDAIGCFAWAEGTGNPKAAKIAARFAGGRLSGCKWPVADGGVADVAVVVARGDDGRITLVLVELRASGVHPETLQTLDPTRDTAKLTFDDTPAEALSSGGDGWVVVETLLDRAAILLAFEQIGGASVCLDMAVQYARDRHAFGRPIGSFQAIKHKLADVYVANELARSNAYFGAWALDTGSAELRLAAASARVSATDAFHLASKENIQTHGGMGFTWESDCHLYYRRAKHLALSIGAIQFWRDRVVNELEARNAA